LSEYNKRNIARIVQKKQYDFYTKWYHNTIRELVTIADFKEDYIKLARMVKPSITPQQARQSVALLLQLGLIEKKHGRYIQTDRAISTGDEVYSLGIQNFHVQNLVMAADAVSLCPAEERDISTLVVGLSPKGFKTGWNPLTRLMNWFAPWGIVIPKQIADYNGVRVYAEESYYDPQEKWKKDSPKGTATAVFCPPPNDSPNMPPLTGLFHFADDVLQICRAYGALMPNSGCRPFNWRSITVSVRMTCGRSPGSLKKTKC